MGSFQTGGYGGVGTAFPSAATFPHYAIQQGIPYNLYGYEYEYAFSLILSLSLSYYIHDSSMCTIRWWESGTCKDNSCTTETIQYFLLLGLSVTANDQACFARSFSILFSQKKITSTVLHMLTFFYIHTYLFPLSLSHEREDNNKVLNT